MLRDGRLFVIMSCGKHGCHEAYNTMVIGFLGKGGSGKSTLSSRFAQHLASAGNSVLAVDADHNMDLTYNLGVSTPFNYVGQSLSDLKKAVGLTDQANYRDAFTLESDPFFSLSPLDAFTEKYSTPVTDRIRLMTCGPHTEAILNDASCSHSLITPLKVYLPFLQLNTRTFAVVDEKAGTDGVGTGITTGFNFAVVVCEPSAHGLKAGNQIAEMLEFYGTPYEFAINKIQDENDRSFATATLKKKPLFHFPFSKEFGRPGSEIDPAGTGELERILEQLRTVAQKSDDRVRRSKEKFTKNREYAKS